MARTLEDTAKYLIRILRRANSAGTQLADVLIDIRDEGILRIYRAIRTGRSEQEVLALARAYLQGEGARINEVILELSVIGAEEQVDTTINFIASLADVPSASLNSPRISKSWVAEVFRRPLPQQKISVNDMVDSSKLNLRQRIVGIVRDAFFRGLTVAEIARIFRDTAEETIDDAALERNAQALARTSISTVSNQARSDTMKANDDVVDRIMFVATLDHRTSDICMVTDGEVWKVDDPKALIPPLHVNCRSTVVPILEGESVAQVRRELDRPSVVPKSQEQLERQGLTTRTGKVRKPSRTDRSPLRGKVETKYQVYEDWLKGQPQYYQREILGNKAFERFRDTGSLRQALNVATL